MSNNNNYLLTREGKMITVSDDELCHYKYVKREKVNGKWRYWYDIGDAGYIDGWTGKKPSRLKSYSKLEDLLGKDEQDRYNRATATTAQAEDRYNNTRNGDLVIANKYAKEYKKAGRNYTEAKTAFMKTPLGKLYQAKTSIKNGKKAIANLLRNVADKID